MAPEIPLDRQRPAEYVFSPPCRGGDGAAGAQPRAKAQARARAGRAPGSTAPQAPAGSPQATPSQAPDLPRPAQHRAAGPGRFPASPSSASGISAAGGKARLAPGRRWRATPETACRPPRRRGRRRRFPDRRRARRSRAQARALSASVARISGSHPSTGPSTAPMLRAPEARQAAAQGLAGPTPAAIARRSTSPDRTSIPGTVAPAIPKLTRHAACAQGHAPATPGS